MQRVVVYQLAVVNGVPSDVNREGVFNIPLNAPYNFTVGTYNASGCQLDDGITKIYEFKVVEKLT